MYRYRVNLCLYNIKSVLDCSKVTYIPRPYIVVYIIIEVS